MISDIYQGTELPVFESHTGADPLRCVSLVSDIAEFHGQAASEDDMQVVMPFFCVFGLLQLLFNASLAF